MPKAFEYDGPLLDGASRRLSAGLCATMFDQEAPSMADPHLPPSAQVIGLLSGSFVAQAVYVAAKLGVADRLAAGPMTAGHLARDLVVDEGALARVLRLLVAQGVFQRCLSGEFANNELSVTLMSGGDESLRDLAVWWCEEPHWRVFGHLLESVRTGRPAWPMVHGTELFPYLADTNPGIGEIFNRAMTSFSRTTIPAVLSAYDFSGAGIVANVGGGHGHLLAAILQTSREARGILCDRPPAVAGAPAQFTAAGVADRARIVKGSFFDPLPFTADTFILRHILHDWPDIIASGFSAAFARHWRAAAGCWPSRWWFPSPTPPASARSAISRCSCPSVVGNAARTSSPVSFRRRDGK